MEEGKWKDALASFRKCVKMEKDFLASKDVTEPKWTFKALQEIVMLCFKVPKTTNDEIIKAYKDMLSYKGDDVNDNLLTRGISKVLDHATTLNNPDLEAALYEATGGAGGSGGDGGNKRIWFKTNMKKATGFLTNKRYDELRTSIKELEKYVIDEGSKSDQLLDVYSLEIQMYMDQGDKLGVKRTYEKAVVIVKSNPGTLTSKMPLFQFCGGKIMMEDGDFDTAYATLFDAFQYLQNIGADTRIPCLKYMLVANMLRDMKKAEAAADGDGDEKEKVAAKINPFDSKEVANMRNHPSIEPVAKLLEAYEKNNISQVQAILTAHKKEIGDDPFLNQFIGRLLTKVRIAKILDMVEPYTRINTQHLATILAIDREEVEDLLVRLVLDNEIEARIDGVKHVLHLESHAQSAARYRSLERWSSQLAGLSRAVSGVVFN